MLMIIIIIIIIRHGVNYYYNIMDDEILFNSGVNFSVNS